MKRDNKERGANVRRNLVLWKKGLFAMVGVWLLLTMAVLGGAIWYAQANHLSQRRAEALAQSCGTVMGLLFLAAWLVVLLLADRKKAE